MKLKFAISAFCFLLSALFASAQVNIGNTTFAVSNLATYGFVNTTNNSSILYRGATIFKPPQFAYQFGPITNAASGSYTTNGITNVVKFVLQQTIDGTNFLNLATNSATGTNGDIITFTPALYNLSIGFRVQILTSNSTAAGAQAIVPQ